MSLLKAVIVFIIILLIYQHTWGGGSWIKWLVELPFKML